MQQPPGLAKLGTQPREVLGPEHAPHSVPGTSTAPSTTWLTLMETRPGEHSFLSS